MNRGGYGYGV